MGIDPILHFLRVPAEVWDGMKSYLLVIFAGIIATSLYNYFSCLLRALGNSTIPLVFLAVSAILNIGLDLLFIAVLPWGIRGVAFATVIAQYVSGIGITLYVLLKCRDLLPSSPVVCSISSPTISVRLVSGWQFQSDGYSLTPSD
ncbi:polysaccharide biosynthesis C-terminal domain-containing protein [Blautia sp.]|uniref:MATE family efflux transporter n=1 Tax=Blautia sp. TaxID=1955243 RepID=UPI003AB38D18